MILFFIFTNCQEGNDGKKRAHRKMPPKMSVFSSARQVSWKWMRQALAGNTQPGRPCRLLLPAAMGATHRLSFSSIGRDENKIENESSDDVSSSQLLFAVKSVYDKSDNWEDWFTPEEYGNPLEFSSSPTSTGVTKTNTRTSRSMILESLDGDTALDASSRHLIRSLQGVYMNGFSSQEIITVQICQSMINRLLTSADEIVDTSSKGTESALKERQRVIRAEAILRTMELFWDLIPDLIEDTSPKKRFIRSSEPRKPAAELPLPTTYMYSTILVKLASLRATKQYQDVNNADIPWITQDLVLRMNRFHQTKGISYIKKPTVMEWNQALSAWANVHGMRDFPEKSVYATLFFMDMTLAHKVQPDVSSYTHVLRACAHGDQDKKALLLGAKVAVKFWNGVLEEALEVQSIRATPHLFVFFMRALSHLPQPKETEYYLEKAWKFACNLGVVNEHVLYELEQTSSGLYQSLVGDYDRRVGSGTRNGARAIAYDKSRHIEMLQYIPQEWMANINRDGNGDGPPTV